MERVITIKGSLDSMSQAESMISTKLRQSYESDLQPQSMMFPGLHPMAMMSTVGMGFPRTGATAAVAAAAAAANTAPGMFPPGAAPYTAGGVYPAGMVPPTGSAQVRDTFYSSCYNKLKMFGNFHFFHIPFSMKMNEFNQCNN